MNSNYKLHIGAVVGSSLYTATILAAPLSIPVGLQNFRMARKFKRAIKLIDEALMEESTFNKSGKLIPQIHRELLAIDSSVTLPKVKEAILRLDFCKNYDLPPYNKYHLYQESLKWNAIKGELLDLLQGKEPSKAVFYADDEPLL